MRWVSQLFALAVVGALGTSALDASIFTFPPTQKEAPGTVSEPQTTSEDVARLILELRVKSSVASVLGRTETDTVEHLNQFSEPKFDLFGGLGDHETIERNMIILDGVESQVVSSIQKIQPNHLLVPRVSSNFAGDDTLSLFLEGDVPAGAGINERRCTYHASDSDAESITAQTAKTCMSTDPVLARARHLLDRDFLDLVNLVETWANKDQRLTASRLTLKSQRQSSQAALVTKSLDLFLHGLADLSAASNREITVLVLPATNESRGSKPRFGHRDSQGTVSQASIFAASQTNAVKRAIQGQSIPSTLAPVCHATNSSCVEATDNCSGHGYCYLKYASDDEKAAGNCYACQCQQTVVKKSDGTTQKVQWGGSACQKRDISSPFFLIAGVSVLAVAMAGSAVGMLFNMGQEELPSVIGAGVGGSKAPM